MRRRQCSRNAKFEVAAREIFLMYQSLDTSDGTSSFCLWLDIVGQLKCPPLLLALAVVVNLKVDACASAAGIRQVLRATQASDLVEK